MTAKDAAQEETPGDAPARSYGPLPAMSGFLLSLAQARVYQLDSERPDAGELSTAQLSVLVVIRENPGIRHGEVADMLMIKLAYMTKLLKGFEKQGWIVRRADRADRRAIELFLTAEGEAVVERELADLLDHDAHRPNGLTAREMVQMKRLLVRYLGLPEGEEAGG